MLKSLVLSFMLLFPNTAHGEQRSEGDFYYLAEAIFHEARGEGFEGMVAVGQNIMVRVKCKYFPNSIEEVVHQYKVKNGKKICQYSYYCDGEPDTMWDKDSKEIAFDVASKIIREEVPDLIGEADHYFNPKKVLPSWAASMRFTKRVGDHVFYKAYTGC